MTLFWSSFFLLHIRISCLLTKKRNGERRICVGIDGCSTFSCFLQLLCVLSLISLFIFTPFYFSITAEDDVSNACGNDNEYYTVEWNIEKKVKCIITSNGWNTENHQPKENHRYFTNKKEESIIFFKVFNWMCHTLLRWKGLEREYCREWTGTMSYDIFAADVTYWHIWTLLLAFYRHTYEYIPDARLRALLHIWRCTYFCLLNLSVCVCPHFRYSVMEWIWKNGSAGDYLISNQNISIQ